jgi:drug/metabolite transporter (DMT)-like permease
MLVLGSLLALLSGMFNAGAAALEKREGMRIPGRSGFRLLVALARRPPWLLAMALSSLAWVAEAASLALAPIPVTATLRNAGRGLLVVGGGRWLGERFSRLELLGVALATAGGILTAISVINSSVSRKLLSNLTQLEVGIIFMLAAGIVAGLATRFGGFGRRHHQEPGDVGQEKVGTPDRAGFADPGQVGTPEKPGNPGREKAAGIAIGAAVGLLFAGTGVFTKEIGDRFAVYGLGALGPVLASSGLWLMLGMTVWAQSLLQQAFRHANAASVSAVNASVASLGLIGAGFVLYGESVPHGAAAVLLIAGIVVSLAGTALLLGTRPVSAAGDQVETPGGSDGTDREGEGALHQGGAN